MEEHTYKSAGVDIDAGNKAVKLMAPFVRATFGPEVLQDIGGFGGLFALDSQKYREPVLIGATDGVGTKLKVAFDVKKYDTIGIDAVAMCVNDLLVMGGEPLFFLDYLAVGRLEPEKVAEIVKGIAAGCLEAGCALIGGETAEMPGFYGEGEFDVAGFTVGVVERSRIIDGSRIEAGNLVIGLPSRGLHSNGYSLARKVFFQVLGWDSDRYVPEFERTLGEELLEPTRIYVKLIHSLLAKTEIRGMAHITGGGLPENLARILPPGLDFVLDKQKIPVMPVFSLLKAAGNVPETDMYRTFNMGLGFVLVISPGDFASFKREMDKQGERYCLLGEVVPGEGRVRFK